MVQLLVGSQPSFADTRRHTNSDVGAKKGYAKKGYAKKGYAKKEHANVQPQSIWVASIN